MVVYLYLFYDSLRQGQIASTITKSTFFLFSDSLVAHLVGLWTIKAK